MCVGGGGSVLSLLGVPWDMVTIAARQGWMPRLCSPESPSTVLLCDDKVGSPLGSVLVT